MNRIDEKTRGVFIISATPFREDGTLDCESTESLTDFYLERGVDGITVLGMMGEAPKLDTKESTQFLQTVLRRVDDQRPVLVGVSHAGLENLYRLSMVAMQAGAAGVMVAPLASLTTDEKLANYYHQVADKLGADVPICFQDYPLSTGVHLSVSTFNQLLDEIPQLVMLKHEDWPGLNKITQIRESADGSAGRRRVSILTGNGGLFLPQELARGADGAMTGFAYPEMLVKVCELYRQQERDLAEDWFDAYLPLVRYEQQPGFGLAVRKEILRRRGAIRCAATRAPGPSLSQQDVQEMGKLLLRLNKKIEALQ